MLRLRRHKSVSDPVAVVNRFVDAANRHDAAGIARCLHPDFESIQPVYPSRNFKGSEQVKRNWQAIFQSEPGFRLSLVRAAASDGTVWVELHGAGSAVEVAGVFIMGVEDELVRWARVYSAVVEQPAAVIDEPVEAPRTAEVPSSPRDEAEELRRTIEAGRQAAGLTGDSVSDDEAPASEQQPAEVALADVDTQAGDDSSDDDTEGADVGSDTLGAATEVLDDQADDQTDDQTDDEGVSVDVVVEPEPVLSTEAQPGTEPETEVVGESRPAEEDPAHRSEEPSTEVRAAVGEVQALAEGARPKRSRNRKRPPHPDGSASPSPSETELQGEGGEVDDATRVRAAARAATEAASQPGQSAPRSGTGSGSRKPRNKGNR